MAGLTCPVDPLQALLSDLNPPQKEAVTTLQGPLLVLAGAGSGKTRVITRRIAYLIASGAPAEKILALTFTNKAAGEMKARVLQLAEQLGWGFTPRNLWIGTFHGFCARLLRREIEVLPGYSCRYSIYDEDDSASLLKRLVEELALPRDPRFRPQALKAHISYAKNHGLGPEALPSNDYYGRIRQEVFHRYQEVLRANNALDFDDLLLLAERVLRRSPEVLVRTRRRFWHLLVDEYQDTNAVQYRLLRLLSEEHRNLCVTGDPDQSIYAWRGADIHNILDFEREFPEAKVVFLEQNYRSTKRILQAASALISHNEKRKRKSLWTQNEAGAPVRLWLVDDEEAEARKVAAALAAHARAGGRYRDCAVFYRTNAQSRLLEKACLEERVPYQLVGAVAFYQRREVKDLLAYLRLLGNPHDDQSWLRVVNVPRRGIGAATVGKLTAAARGEGKSLGEYLAQGPAERAGLGKKPAEKVVGFLRLMQSLRQLPPFPVRQLLEAVLEQSGYLAELDPVEDLERRANVNELINAAADYDQGNEGNEEAGLDDFLEGVALVSEVDKYDSEADSAVLMTLHMAKGLEFPQVFICGVEEGLIPWRRPGKSDREAEEETRTEEERRLFFVGLTRAMERLTLCCAAARRRAGTYEPAAPSSFLEEIPGETLEIEDETGAGTAPVGVGGRSAHRRMADPLATGGGDEAEYDPADLEAQRWRHGGLPEEFEARDAAGFWLFPGDRVEHPQFGRGTILALFPAAGDVKLTIRFDAAGRKNLRLSYAKLWKV